MCDAEKSKEDGEEEEDQKVVNKFLSMCNESKLRDKCHIATYPVFTK